MSTSTITPPAIDGSRSVGEYENDRSSVARRLAIVAYVVTRIWILLFVVPVASDRIVYFRYAVRGVDAGQVAYEDFEIEYPPVAYWVMAAPRVVDGDRLTREMLRDKSEIARRYGRYSLLFRLQMLLVDAFAFVLFLDLVRRRRPDLGGIAAWGYVGCTAALHHVLLDRLDIGLLALLLGWLWARARVPDEGRGGWANVASYALLGLGIAYKLVGVVALPFVILADWRATDGAPSRRCLVVTCLLLVTAAAAALPFAAHAPFAGTSTLGFLEYHSARGIQIESTYASGLFVASWLGLPIDTAVAYGSANVESAWSATLTRASPFVLVIVLGLLGVSALRQGGDYGRRFGDLDGVLAILLTLVLSKVLSEQYLLFGLPLLLLAAANGTTRSRYLLIVVASIGIGALSTVVFPHLWFAISPTTKAPNPYCLVPNLHWLPCSVLLVRNLAFASLVIGTVLLSRRRDES